MPATCHRSRRTVNGKTAGLPAVDRPREQRRWSVGCPQPTGRPADRGLGQPTLHLAAALRRAFGGDLPAWYRRHRRDLPWRRTRDPYRIWVSEIMLQQTRVDVVRDYYARWLRAFPSLTALARASDLRVLKLWEGLGYYQRARNLHAAARQLAHAPVPALPRTSAELRRLPGIGPYTAAAVASIAFGERVAVVDGNVARVLARVLALRWDVTRPAAQRQLVAWVQALMPPAPARESPGDFNQAMMELGALVCTPANPRCPVCPLRGVCRARRAGLTAVLPNRGGSRRPEVVALTAALVRGPGGRVLVRRRGAGGMLAGLWELPVLPAPGLRQGRALFQLTYTITHRRITLAVHAASRVGGPFPRTAQWRWIGRRELARLAFPAGQRRALAQAFSALTMGSGRGRPASTRLTARNASDPARSAVEAGGPPPRRRSAT